MVRRTKAEAEQTRQLILDTAQHVFFEKGVARTSLADIAQAAGLTRGAIYWHFANKVDLFDAMHARIKLPLDEAFERLASHPAPLTGLRELCVRELEDLVDNPQKRMVLSVVLHKCEYVDELGQLCERFDGHCRDVQVAIERLLARSLALGESRSGLVPALAALALHNFMLGTMSDWLFAPARYDLKIQAAGLVELFFRALVREG